MRWSSQPFISATKPNLQTQNVSHEAKELLRKFDEETGDSLNASKRINGEEPDKPAGHKKKKGLFK